MGLKTSKFTEAINGALLHTASRSAPVDAAMVGGVLGGIGGFAASDSSDVGGHPVLGTIGGAVGGYLTGGMMGMGISNYANNYVKGMKGISNLKAGENSISKAQYNSMFGFNAKNLYKNFEENISNKNTFDSARKSALSMYAPNRDIYKGMIT